MGKNGDTFDERLRSRNGHRIMVEIGLRIGMGIAARIRSRIVHWNSEKEVQLKWAKFGAAISGRSGLKKSRIQRIFVGVPDRHRLKFKARFLPHGNSPIHSLLILQSRCPSDVLSSRIVHRTRHIRSQNRGTSRNGLVDGETSHVSESSRSNRISTSHLFARRQAADKAFKLISFNSSQGTL